MGARHWSMAAEQRAVIDAAFAGMADDSEARQESLAIAEEFAVADWEALRLGEDEP